GSWHMFNGGVSDSLKPGVRLLVHDTTPPANLGKSSIGHTDVASTPLPGTHEPIAIIASGGTWYLYYFQFPDLQTTQGQLYAATSTDLEHWQSKGVVISDTLLLNGGFDVIAYGGQFLAFTATASGVSMLTSGNLLSWSAPTSIGLGVSRL